MLKVRFLAFQMSVYALVFLQSVVFADAGEGIDFGTNLGAIPDSLCNAAEFLRGPVGGIIALGTIIWGVVQWQTGGRGGIALIVSGVVGGLVLVALPTMLAVLQVTDCTLGA